MSTFPCRAAAAIPMVAWLPGPALCAEDKRPNVILIICDDLTDDVEGFGGHPQARTPKISRLSRSGVSFTQAHCNIPYGGPSRASCFTGIYPHHSLCYGFERWDKHPVLKNSRTIMDHFRANGYHTLGTGKLMHHLVRKEWEDYGNPSDYGPFAFMDTFADGAVFSSIDHAGRYAYRHQPGLARWNLTCFAQALLPVVASDQNQPPALPPPSLRLSALPPPPPSFSAPLASSRLPSPPLGSLGTLSARNGIQHPALSARRSASRRVMTK